MKLTPIFIFLILLIKYDTVTNMGYQSTLESAGATVHCFREFGSYQGEWWAKVTYKGETGWIRGAYGSCTGCDAFEAEFGWSDNPTKEQLASFGKQYLDDSIMTHEEALKKAARDLQWDEETKDMVDFIKENEK